MKLPKIYKKNSKGTLEEWEISTKANYITIIFGDELGKKQVKHEKIKEGKNLGRKLETTAVEQAEKEAKSRFNAQLKKGYCKTKADALAGKTDEIIKGGILPMLAEKYKDQKDKIVFPCAVQPKLDGQRCIAIREGGTVTLWTRTRKPITSCPHIIEAVLGTLNGVDGDIVLDGELYNNDLKHNFEALMSAVKKKEPSPESLQVQFHVYDCHVQDDIPQSFNERLKFLNDLPEFDERIQFVETFLMADHMAIQHYHDKYVKQGYEGLMVRDLNSFYENKRSKGLLKMKDFHDDEYEIIDVIPGGDSSVIFKCKDSLGVTFEAPMNGNKENNQKYLKNRNLWEGKKLNVRYQGLTGAKKVPRFPQGKYIREEE
jgi:DNA ligase-1